MEGEYEDEDRRKGIGYLVLVEKISSLHTQCEVLSQSVIDFGKMVDRQAKVNDSVASLAHELNARSVLLEKLAHDSGEQAKDFRCWMKEHENGHFPSWGSFALYSGIAVALYQLYDWMGKAMIR